MDPDAALEARRRALGGLHPRCSVSGCPETDPRALTGAAPVILCAEHRVILDGRRTVEDHHPAGRHNTPTTVGLPANRHAVLTFVQQSGWRTELLRNPNNDLLVRLEAAVRGSRETIAQVLDGVLAPTEAEIAILHDFLVSTLGPDWYEVFRRWMDERTDAP